MTVFFTVKERKKKESGRGESMPALTAKRAKTNDKNKNWWSGLLIRPARSDAAKKNPLPLGRCVVNGYKQQITIIFLSVFFRAKKKYNQKMITFSDAEKTIINFLAADALNKDMAASLAVSESAIKKRVAKLKRKLQAKTRHGLIVRLYTIGYLKQPIKIMQMIAQAKLNPH